MSLVHEALQKAEREKQRRAGLAPSVPPPVATTSHTVQTSTTHAPAPVPIVAALEKEPAPQETASRAVEPPKTPSFLLPALIGCVAIVAIIAIVFLATNAATVLRQAKEIAPVQAVAPVPVARSTEPARPQSAGQAPASASAPARVSPAASPSAPAAVAADETKYKLSGIMTDPDGKFVAVLNGRVAYEGYYIDGATVKKIERNRVTIDADGHEQVLRLF